MAARVDEQAPAAAPNDEGARRFGRSDSVALAAVAVLGGFVCFWRLGTASLGVDEPVYANAGWSYVHGDWDPNKGHPLLAKQLLGLAQLAFGRGVGGIRVLDAVLGLLAGVLLFDLGRRLHSLAAGVLAGVMWFVLPQAPGTIVVRLDRYAMLEPTMVCFGLLGLWCTTLALPRRSWPWVAAAGASFGLAASAKLPGATYAVGLAAVVVAAPLPARGRLRLASIAAGAALLGFFVPYLAAGSHMVDHLRAIPDQLGHADAGHPQLIAGRVRLHHPWWAGFWWQQTYLGVAATVALWAAAIGGIVALRGSRRLVVLGGLLGPLVFFTWSPLKLPHYHLAIVPVLALAAAVGLAALVHRAVGQRGWPRGAALALVAVIVVLLAVPGTRNLVDVARLRPADYRAVPAVLAAAGVVAGDVAVWGWPHVLGPALPDGLRATGLEARDPVAVVVDPVVADRQRGGVEQQRVLELVGDRVPVRVDRLEVYVLSP